VAREPQNPRLVSFVRARASAARLDVDPWAVGICLACLSVAVFPLADGDERTAMTWMRRMTPQLWAEGLDEYAVAVARAHVLRLAEVEAQRLRAEWDARGCAHDRLLRAPPELN
jgi:hypothetical protein